MKKKKTGKEPDKPSKKISKLKPPVRFRTALESHLKGRAEIWPVLLKHRKAIERIAIEHKILPTDRAALLVCATLAFSEIVWEEVRANSPALDKPGKN